jgi:hypothetical protein
MRSAGRWIAIAVIAALGLGASGCPILMIPGLAYSGYQYEKTGHLPGMPLASPSAASTASQSTPADSSIE